MEFVSGDVIRSLAISIVEGSSLWLGSVRLASMILSSSHTTNIEAKCG